MKIAVILLGLLALSGCDQSIRKAHDAVKETLFDPNSAEFRNDHVMSDGTVCGEVNAKNRMGGYVGFTEYAVGTHGVPVHIGEDVRGDCDEEEIAFRIEKRKYLEELRQQASQSANSLHSPRGE